jgi:hypothetical protein
MQDRDGKAGDMGQDSARALGERYVSRRDFLKLAGGAGTTVILAGGLGGLLGACGGEEATTSTAAREGRPSSLV